MEGILLINDFYLINEERTSHDFDQTPRNIGKYRQGKKLTEDNNIFFQWIDQSRGSSSKCGYLKS